MEDVIRRSVGEILPKLGKEKIEALVGVLMEKGVGEPSDLKFVEAAFMIPLVTPIEANKLIQGWKSMQVNENPVARQSFYRICWGKLAEGTLKKLNSGQCLSRGELNKVIDTVVVDAKETVPGLRRNMFRSIAEDMVKKYPKLDPGSTSNDLKGCLLEEKLKIKLDNLNRKRERTVLEFEAPGLPEAYGCKRWRVKDLPTGETESTLNRKKEEMKKIYKEKRPRDWDWEDDIFPLLDDTYCIQRKEINSQVLCSKSKQGQPPVSTQELKRNWPLLFQYQGISYHFTKLTDLKFESGLAEFMKRDDLPTLIDFLAGRTKTNTKIKEAMNRAIKRNEKDSELIAIILMLLQALKEDVDSVIQVVEGTATREEITELCNVPPTPCIIAAGQSLFRAKRFFISIDSQVVSFAKSFAAAFITFFCSFFVFNLRYPPKAPCTLDFVQRQILQLSPPVGSKIPSQQRKGKRVKSALTRLLADFAAFKEQQESTENESQTE